MSAYQHLYRFLATLEAWFEAGGFIRDRHGTAIYRLPEVIVAIEEERWPINEA